MEPLNGIRSCCETSATQEEREPLNTDPSSLFHSSRPIDIHALIRNICSCESDSQRLQIVTAFLHKHQNMIMVVIYSLAANITTTSVELDIGTSTTNEEKIKNILITLAGMGVVLIISTLLKIIKNCRNLACEDIIKAFIKDVIAYFAVATATAQAHYPPLQNPNNSNFGNTMLNGLTTRETLILTNTVLQLLEKWYLDTPNMPNSKHITANFASGPVLGVFFGTLANYMLVTLSTHCAEKKYSTADTTAIIASAIFLCDVLFAFTNTMRLFILNNIFSNLGSTDMAAGSPA